MPHCIGTITVVGAGPLGRSVVYLAARAGYRTILEDLSGQMTGPALDEIRRAAEDDVQYGRLASTQLEALLQRVEAQRMLDVAAAEADLIIETAPDDLETKVEVYTRIDRAAPPACIFAATTVAIPISEIASLTYRPAQVLGMCFSLGDAKRLELVKGPDTSEETLEICRELGARMERDVVVLRELSAASRL